MCRDIVGPECTLSGFFRNNTLLVPCNERVKLNCKLLFLKVLAVELSDIELQITGPKAPYVFTYYIGENLGYTKNTETETFYIYVNLLSSMAGQNQDVTSS